jgi:hypothetical protein
MISDEQRFVWDLDSLRDIAKSPAPKNLLDASVILWRLLTDSAGPLIHRISRKTGLKPRFRVFVNREKNEFQQLIDGFPVKDSLISMYLNPDPSIADKPNTKEVDLDEFLACPMTFFEGKILTVKEIINYVANVGGGVHQGQPTRRDNAQTIHRTANSLWINGKPYPLENLRNIMNITTAALVPHYDRLRA